MRNVVLIFLLLLTANAQPLPQPDREFRAVWIATVDNVDFPSQKGLSPEKQKEELLATVELARKLRLNALVFQVRPMADAVYRSSLEPWSEFLTGAMGKPQDFDPLDFLIAEAHKRGILVHAWFNPYRAYHPAAKTPISNDHVARRKPTAVKQYGRYMWLDPTSPEAQRHSLEVIADVVRRYDVDGVHFDDYFYPYAEKDAAGKDIDFPDDENWRKYEASGGKLTRDDWRRAHVNEFIEEVGRTIKRVKPDVVYGISPFGIWQPAPEKGIRGFNSYEKLYADSRKWLRDGTVDYLAPQLYWETARDGQSFPVLLDWWDSQNTQGRHIWPGIATYRIGTTTTFTADEIRHQIELTRRSGRSGGAIQFSFKWLRRDIGGIQNILGSVYTRDAIVPRSPWIKAPKPKSPSVKIKRNGGMETVSWVERGKRRAFWFIVYVKDLTGWSYSIVPASEHSMSLPATRGVERIVVRSVDRIGQISGD